MCKKDFGFSKKTSGGGSSVAAPEGWTRPTEWLAMPTINTGTKKFAGLFAVFNDRHNEANLILVNNGYNATINWGDGTTFVGSGSQSKIYTYASVSSPVLTDELGRTYKHVLITIDFHASENIVDLYISRKCNHWLELKIGGGIARIFAIVERKPICLKILDIVSHLNIALGVNFAGLNLLERFRFNTTGVVTSATFNQLNKSCRNLNGDPIDWTFTATDVTNGLNGINTDVIGTISLPNATNCTSFLRVNGHTVGDISIPVATNLTNFALFSVIRKAKLISSSSLANLNQAFHDSTLLEDLEITDCSGVTTTNLFSNNNALRRLILTGLTRGVNISNQNHDTASLNAFFTSLGTASGSQTITITGNPGAGTADTSIATGKGYTIVN
jgi:hypothetical protein